jgi:hypothetical protein
VTGRALHLDLVDAPVHFTQGAPRSFFGGIAYHF